MLLLLTEYLLVVILIIRNIFWQIDKSDLGAVMVYDRHIQMFPVKQEYVATPISKIHSSRESLLYHRQEEASCLSHQNGARNEPSQWDYKHTFILYDAVSGGQRGEI